MTRVERVIDDFRKTLNEVNKQGISLSDKTLQMISQSLLSISITLAQMLDAMEGEPDVDD